MSIGRRLRALLAATWIGLLGVACGGDEQPSTASDDAGSSGQGARAGEAGEDSTGPSVDEAGSSGGDAAAGRAGAGAGPVVPRAGNGGAGGSGGAGTAAAAGSGGGSQAACPDATLAAGDAMKTLMHDGAAREYLVHVPSRYDGETAVPLVIDLHGWTYDAADQADMSGWREKADAEGFIVAYPQGLDNSFNGGAVCCGTAQEDEVEDRGFVRAVVAQLRDVACIDPKRVYATGLSNGGALAHVLACRDADLFAAVAPVSMGNATRPCQPVRPVSMIMYRGTADDLVPYDGDETYPSAATDFEAWLGLNACSSASSVVRGACERHAECRAGAEVTLCTIRNGEHLLYSDAAAAGASVADVAWEVFERHALP